MTDKQSLFLQQIRAHILPVILTAICLVLVLGGKITSDLFRYEASLINNGEIWRLITAHLVHLGWSHTLLNIAGLALIWGLFWNTFDKTPWLVITLVSGLSISLGLYLLNPELTWYVGLSGVLHGLFVAGTLGSIRQGNHREAILLVAIIGKLLWEQAYGPMPGTADMAGGPVIVDAHLYGAIGGAISALLFKPRMWC